jgi:hypothetical protein
MTENSKINLMMLQLIEVDKVELACKNGEFLKIPKFIFTLYNSLNLLFIFKTVTLVTEVTPSDVGV